MIVLSFIMAYAILRMLYRVYSALTKCIPTLYSAIARKVSSKKTQISESDNETMFSLIIRKVSTIMNRLAKNTVISAKNQNSYALILAEHLKANPEATMENSAIMRQGSAILKNVANMPLAMKIEYLENVESVVGEVYLASFGNKNAGKKVYEIGNLIRAAYNESKQIPAWVDNVLGGNFEDYLTSVKTVKKDGKNKPTNIESTIASVGVDVVGNSTTIIEDTGDNPLATMKGHKVRVGDNVLKVASWSSPFDAQIFTLHEGDIGAFKKGSTFTLDVVTGYVWTITRVNTDMEKVYATYSLKRDGSKAVDNKPTAYTGKPTESASAATAKANTKDSKAVPATPTKAEVLARVMALLATIED